MAKQMIIRHLPSGFWRSSFAPQFPVFAALSKYCFITITRHRCAHQESLSCTERFLICKRRKSFTSYVNRLLNIHLRMCRPRENIFYSKFVIVRPDRNLLVATSKKDNDLFKSILLSDKT